MPTSCFNLLHNFDIANSYTYFCLFLDMFEKRKNWMRSRMCKNSVGEPLHGRTVKVTKPHWTHVGLHKRCAELYHRGRVLNQVATAHLKPQRRLRWSRHVISRKDVTWIKLSLFLVWVIMYCDSALLTVHLHLKVHVKYMYTTFNSIILHNWFFMTPSIATKFQYINSL
jgi:hypothetical protein